MKSLLIGFLAVALVAGQRQYCGPALHQMLSLVCQYEFNGHNTHKRVSDLPGLEPELSWPFHTKNEAVGRVLVRRPRYTTGIYEECCLKGCSISELSYYCKI